MKASHCNASSIVLAAVIFCGCQKAEVGPSPAQSSQTTATRTTTKSPVVAEPKDAPTSPAMPEGIQFNDVAPTMGIDFRFFEDRVPGRFLLPEVMGGGVGWADFDHDGWMDLYFVNGTVLDPKPDSPKVPGSRLYRNRHGKSFFDASSVMNADNGGYGQGVSIADYNSDGFKDVFVSNYGMDKLYAGNGDGTFTDVTEDSGIGDPLWSTSAVWLDVNDDDLLDLYCANYMNVTLSNNQVCYYGDKAGYCGPGKYDGLKDALWLNTGDGGFREAAGEVGLSAPSSKGLAVCVIDLDRDLKPEIYVANDMESNLLFTRTDQNGGVSKEWRETAAAAGTAVSGDGLNEASMGIAAADYDNDGLPDLYLTHYYQMKNTLYHNLGGMLFEDDSLRSGVAATSYQYLGFGTIPIDANGDGRMDVFIANGHVLGPAIEPNAMTPQLLLNLESGFQDVSSSCGSYFADAWIGRGVAGGDFDNDGDLDIAVSHIDRPVVLLRNDCQRSQSFVGFDLVQESRTLPIGARVRVTQESRSLELTQSAGGSYLSTGDSRLLFYVSDAPCSVEVTWPNGEISRFDDVKPGRHYQIRKNGIRETSAL
ncbi:MAG: CRTAC1 family protein [Planctomycetaceae bacterium]|nr:CRTAC1 family protein [Planctomycetaceae bacterium]